MSAFFVPTRFTWRFGGSVVGLSSLFLHLISPAELAKTEIVSVHLFVQGASVSALFVGHATQPLLPRSYQGLGLAQGRMSRNLLIPLDKQGAN